MAKTQNRNAPIGYRSAQVLAYIEEIVEEDGLAPTYAMIADEFAMTTAHVSHVVARLESRGFVKRHSVTKRQSMGWHKPVIVLAARTATT